MQKACFAGDSLTLCESLHAGARKTLYSEQMDRIFIDDLRYAHEVTAARFGQRSWFQQVAELGANLITRLL